VAFDVTYDDGPRVDVREEAKALVQRSREEQKKKDEKVDESHSIPSNPPKSFFPPNTFTLL